MLQPGEVPGSGPKAVWPRVRVAWACRCLLQIHSHYPIAVVAVEDAKGLARLRRCLGAKLSATPLRPDRVDAAVHRERRCEKRMDVGR